MKKFLVVLALISLSLACGPEPGPEFNPVRGADPNFQPSEKALELDNYWIDNASLTGMHNGEAFVGDLYQIRGRSNSYETLIDIIVTIDEENAAMGRMVLERGFSNGLEPGFESQFADYVSPRGLRCTGPAPMMWDRDMDADDMNIRVRDLGLDAREVTFSLQFLGEETPLVGRFDVYPKF